jgi:hypothetical protein
MAKRVLAPAPRGAPAAAPMRGEGGAAGAAPMRGEAGAAGGEPSVKREEEPSGGDAPREAPSPLVADAKGGGVPARALIVIVVTGIGVKGREGAAEGEAAREGSPVGASGYDTPPGAAAATAAAAAAAPPLPAAARAPSAMSCGGGGGGGTAGEEKADASRESRRTVPARVAVGMPRDEGL